MTLFILVLYVGFGNKSVCSKIPVQCHPARYDITETWGLFAELTHKCKCSTWFYRNHCSTISHPMLCAPIPRLHGPNTSLWILVWFEREKKPPKTLGTKVVHLWQWLDSRKTPHSYTRRWFKKVVLAIRTSHLDDNVWEGNGWPASWG